MDRLRRRPRQRWDRFAHWAPGAAILVLCGFVLLMIAAALTQRTDLPEAPMPAPAAIPSPVETAAPRIAADGEDPARDTDLRLYDRIAERVDAGEGYYTAAVEEQRARDFPVRPGLAVRLPTLAYMTAVFEPWGMGVLGAVLGVLTLLAWWLRLHDENGGSERRVFVLLLLVIGAGVGFKPQYLALHEVWAGLLIALSLGLHRPRKWHLAWLAAALALMIREHALPFVLLMGAMSLVRGHRTEALAWAGTDRLDIAINELRDIARHLNVTLGSRGCLALTPDGKYEVNGVPTRAVDTTGAGDVFHGALTLGLARGLSTHEAFTFASAAAAIKCTRPGGIRGAPRAAEVNDFLHRHTLS